MKKWHVNSPYIADREGYEKIANEAFARNYFTNDGEIVKELEQEFAKYHEVKYAVAVCSATIGLQIVAKALGLKGEVIMPAWTFVATAHAISWIGLEPVFCDVDFYIKTITEIQAGPLITDRTAAILGVHMLGNAGAAPGLEELAYRKSIPLFFDAAHAVGCSWNAPVGNYGDAEVFSLHATKILNSFEGGIITTNNEVMAHKCQLMRNFGFEDYRVHSIGINAKMSEIHAAMGLANLMKLPQSIAHAKEIYEAYSWFLSTVSEVQIWEYKEWSPGQKFNYQYVVITISAPNRDNLMGLLRTNGIMARRYFWPGVHLIPPYNINYYGELPNTKKLCEETLFLPSGGDVTTDDVRMICDKIKEFYK